MLSPTMLRNLVLVGSVGQNVLIVLFMHHSRTAAKPAAEGPMYRSSVAVFLAEAFKLPLCLTMIGCMAGGVGPLKQLLQAELLGERRLDTLKCAVPGLCYTVQNTSYSSHSRTSKRRLSRFASR